MLHVKPVVDDSCEKFLLSEGVKTSYAEGVDVALYEDEVMIGAARVSFAEDLLVGHVKDLILQR